MQILHPFIGSAQQYAEEVSNHPNPIGPTSCIRDGNPGRSSRAIPFSRRRVFRAACRTRRAVA